MTYFAQKLPVEFLVESEPTKSNEGYNVVRAMKIRLHELYHQRVEKTIKGEGKKMERLIRTNKGYMTPDQILSGDFSEDMFVLNVTVGEGMTTRVRDYAERAKVPVVYIDTSMHSERIDLMEAINSVEGDSVVVCGCIHNVPSLIDHDLIKQMCWETEGRKSGKKVCFFLLIYGSNQMAVSLVDNV